MEIVVLDGNTLNPGDLSWDGFKKLGNLKVYDRTLSAEVVVRATGAEIIITNKVIISRAVMALLPTLKYIGVLATGYNVVDIAAACESGIVVTNVPAYSTDSVAQLVFGHILNFTNRIGLHATEVRNGKWTGYPDFCYRSTPQTELAGKTLGIIGLGRIGGAVAHIGHAFGMQVVFQNRSPKTGLPEWLQQTDMESVFRESDFITLHCQLTADNQGFVNQELLALMKPTAFLINTGRGLLINEADLAIALNRRVIAGAGLDVLSTEPPGPGNLLLTALNCYITPHMGWATFEARTRLMHTAVENLRAFLEGKPRNVVG